MTESTRYRQSEKTKRRVSFSNLSEFRFPQNIQETGQYEKLDEIKDLYIAIRQSVFKYFPNGIYLSLPWNINLKYEYYIADSYPK